MKLKLKKFDKRNLKDDSVVVLMGKRNVGKSFLLRDLLSVHQDIPQGLIISPTEMANGFFSKFAPKIFLQEEYDPRLIKTFIEARKKAVKQWKKDKRVDPRSFLIFDDCMYDSKSWAKDKNIRLLFMNGRHYKTMFLITMQFPLGIPPTLRTNVDFVFILRENFISNRKRIYEHWAGMFPDFKIFCAVMDHCTDNYGCLVIDNTIKSNKLEDMVYWYKAEDQKRMRLGHPFFWQQSEGMPEESDDEEEFKMPNKKYPDFRVQKI